MEGLKALQKCSMNGKARIVMMPADDTAVIKGIQSDASDHRLAGMEVHHSQPSRSLW
jgi:hypothetical protein